MYENSIENDWKAASTTCLPGAGAEGGESIIALVMLGLKDTCDAARWANEARAARLAM